MYLSRPSDRKVPGETVFTRISSGARCSDRFLLMLVNAALAAVYAMRPAVWRLVECADTLTMRPHSAARIIGRHERTHRTALHAPISIAADHSSSVSCSMFPWLPGPTTFTNELTVPPHRSPMVANAASIDSASLRSVVMASGSGLPSARND